MSDSAMIITTQNKLTRWYKGRSPSEQNLLFYGGILVFVTLAWVLIYQPVVSHIEQQASIKNRLQNQLTQMQDMSGSTANEAAMQVLPIPTGMTFSSWVDQQLRVVKLQDMVNRTEPIDENRISIWLQNAPFDQVIDWLQDISNRYAIQVDQIDINVVDENLGLTNIRMRLVK